jgi:hypothetical protein
MQKETNLNELIEMLRHQIAHLLSSISDRATHTLQAALQIQKRRFVVNFGQKCSRVKRSRCV